MQIKNPQWLEIESGENVFYGLRQEWFSSAIKRASGCGPTTASTLLLYLNRRDNGPLPYENHDVKAAVTTLEEVWNFITPGVFGLNSTKKFVTGMQNLLRHYNAPWECRELAVNQNESPEKAAEFIEAGLSADCPVAFLNLHAGKSSAFESWHWLVLVALEACDNRYVATGYDDGKKIEFDLNQWVESTRKGGGFIYLT